MKRKEENTFICPICQRRRPLSDGMHGDLIRVPIVELIQKKHPAWSSHDLICSLCLNHFRADYIEDVLETEKGELSTLEEEVVKSLKDQELLSQNINAEFDRQLTLGERMADKIAEFGGSWHFIITFAVILALWVIINSAALLWRPFDPYPFILLNLILSTLAAVQAPIIMMSQNRQEAKDRLRSEYDYRVNLKAEPEIRHLHAKIDQLPTHQWRRLLEIQQMQMELM